MAWWIVCWIPFAHVAGARAARLLPYGTHTHSARARYWTAELNSCVLCTLVVRYWLNDDEFAPVHARRFARFVIATTLYDTWRHAWPAAARGRRYGYETLLHHAAVFVGFGGVLRREARVEQLAAMAGALTELSSPWLHAVQLSRGTPLYPYIGIGFLTLFAFRIMVTPVAISMTLYAYQLGYTSAWRLGAACVVSALNYYWFARLLWTSVRVSQRYTSQ